MREAIEAHLTIVFTALAVSHAVQARTGPAIGKVVKQLRPLRSATITINGATQTFQPDVSRGPAKDPHAPRVQAGVLSEMSKLRRLRIHRSDQSVRSAAANRWAIAFVT